MNEPKRLSKERLDEIKELAEIENFLVGIDGKPKSVIAMTELLQALDECRLERDNEKQSVVYLVMELSKVRAANTQMAEELMSLKSPSDGRCMEIGALRRRNDSLRAELDRVTKERNMLEAQLTAGTTPMREVKSLLDPGLIATAGLYLTHDQWKQLNGEFADVRSQLTEARERLRVAEEAMKFAMKNYLDVPCEKQIPDGVLTTGRIVLNKALAQIQEPNGKKSG